MIVNATLKGWEVIFQRAHGLLAVQIAHHWLKDQRPRRWIESLAAITEHDDGQEPLHDHHHLTEAGAPKDFTFLEFDLSQAKKVTETAQYKSRWVALLISRHMTFLYQRLRGKNKEIDKFLDLQMVNQEKWQKELKIIKKEIDQAYNLLQWCDRCSLILSKNQLPEDEKLLEVYKGPDDRNYMIFQRKDQSVSVDPWPFEELQFTLWVETRELSKLHFENDEDLNKELKGCQVKLKEWKFVK
jgi:hypothetical protein